MTTPLPVPREAVLIVNARSRRGAALFEQARRKIEAAGIRLIAAHPVRDPDLLDDTVRDAIRSVAAADDHHRRAGSDRCRASSTTS